MTKEELEKEAEEFTDTKKSFWRQGRTCIGSVKQAYIAGAEPREKRIEKLFALVQAERKRQEQCNDIHLRKIAELEKENAELELKIKCLTRHLELQTMTELFEQVEEEVKQEQRLNELEAQIKKMKCCGNCKYLAGKFDGKTHINILFCKEADMREIQVGFNMCCCKWEIKEND